VAGWLEFLVLTIVWTPVLVLLHELGHAFAALLLTRGEVTIEMRSGGLDGGSATYNADRLRRPRDEAWIAAAGPAVSLAAACVLWWVWLRQLPHDEGKLAFVGAWVATAHFLATALPIRYGAGFSGPMESDGRAVWRILIGAPPGGIERELRRFTEPESSVRPVFAVPLVLIGVLTFVMDPVLGVFLVGVFGIGALLQRRG
jgi:hypothetical protein